MDVYLSAVALLNSADRVQPPRNAAAEQAYYDHFAGAWEVPAWLMLLRDRVSAVLPRKPATELHPHAVRIA